jgi:hypothetical protein
MGATHMVSYIVVSVLSGILFGILDAVINANPLGRKLNEAYKPIARTSMNMPAGIVIDLVYGFAMAGIFAVLFNSLPGETGLIKGISFGFMAWFFRVVMSAASHWMMFTVPIKTLLYNLAAGLVEMMILGLIYGGFLKPWT